MNEAILDVRNLQVTFPSNSNLLKAVDGISFEIRQGQTLGIVGESGSGKSVTALAIMGLVPPLGRVPGGEIWFRDTAETQPVNLLTLPERQLRHYRGGKVAMIFQDPMSSLNPVYTIGFQLVEAIQAHQTIPNPEARRRAIALLQEVKLLPSDQELAERLLQEKSEQGTANPSTQRTIAQAINQQKQAILERYPHQLSGGQIQRVMIAMAICADPVLLIADEPTTALDVTVQATILDLLRQLCTNRNMSMIFITHDLGVIAEIAETIAVMYQGNIVESGPVLDIFSHPQHPYTQGLLTCRPRPNQRLKTLPTVADFMEVSTSETGEVVIRSQSPQQSQIALELLGDGPSLLQDDRFSEVSAAELETRLNQLQTQTPLLTVNNLRVAFPVKRIWGQAQRYFTAVNDVSFQVYPGETLGLVGESGCGKTTLARTLLQLIKPTGGQVIFDGQDIIAQAKHNPSALRKLRQEMQIIFQNPYSSLDPRMTIGEAVMEPLRIHQRGNRQAWHTRAADLLERVGLSRDTMNRYPHEFSGGQRQRICIARALTLNPRFIICDESVSALDVSVQAQVLNLLRDLQREFNLTYIFISHDLSVVKFMSDRIMVMNKGKVEEIGPAEQIYRESQQPYTQQLIAAIPQGSLETIRQRQVAQQRLA